jgi:mono/diheme cytochrome c family protein
MSQITACLRSPWFFVFAYSYTIMKTTLITLGIIVSLIAVFLLYVQLTFKKDFQPPVTGIKSSTDSSVIARGKYLALGSAHCYTCHMPDSMQKRGYKEMIGGNPLKTPFATFYTPNITSDKETGIGNFTDEQLARAIRYNVNHNNKAMVGFMTYNGMSDDDIAAIISYLRSSRPIRNRVPEHDYNMLGKILMRFMVKPVSPTVENLKPDTSAAYGKYLAYNVMNCNGCHTQRGSTGKFIGEPFAGGHSWDLEDGKYTTANLTPDDSTGRISKWSPEVFIQRFRAGRVLPNSPMPWDAYKIISDNDLKAIYEFLKQLPPVHKEVTTYIPKKDVAEVQANR